MTVDSDRYHLADGVRLRFIYSFILALPPPPPTHTHTQYSLEESHHVQLTLME